MAVSIFANGTDTGDGTEHSLVTSPETTPGVYQLVLDTRDLAPGNPGESVYVQIKEKVGDSSNTQVTLWEDTVNWTQPSWVGPVIMLSIGWDMTLTQVGTADIIWHISQA